MFDRRYEITGTLEVLSPLHVGTGEVGEIAGVKGREGSNEPAPEVALIVRDYKADPYLPSTTIKGLLRRLGEAIAPDHVIDLFGKIKDADGTGNMGAILVRGASLGGAPPDVSQYPYVKTAGAKLGPGVFVAARTAIDANSGTAADHKLYFQEMVAPGAKFELRLTLIADDKRPDRLTCLLRILAALTNERGVVCGRGQADGSGALQLRAGSLKVAESKIDDNGVLKSSPIGKDIDLLKIAAETRARLRQGLAALGEGAEPAVVATPSTWRGTFRCEGPFLSVDSSWDPVAAKGGDENKKVPQLVYQHGADNQPLDLGSQIAGVLRARARWIMGLKALALGIDDITRVDPGAKDETEGKRVVRTSGDVAKLKLRVIERLFGVSGFAGLLVIEKMHFSGGEPENITSVKLDHFSGAPIDKALFTTRAVIGTKLELVLELRDRGGVGKPRPADRVLFKKLQADIEKNGLMLGHGSGKGFGWFEPI